MGLSIDRPKPLGIGNFYQSRQFKRSSSFPHRMFWKKISSKGASSSKSDSHIVTRDLEEADYNKGYLELLSQLTQVGDYDEATFKARFNEIKALPTMYKVVVIEDLNKKKIIATASLVVELKFIRNCSKCGHIEDVVVDSSYRGLRLGVRVIEALIEASKDLGCYKVILDCSEQNVPFYEKCGLIRKEVQMVKYL